MGNAFLWKWGYRSFKTDRNKLFASDKRQIDSQVDNQAAWHASLIYVSYVYLPL